MNQLIINGVYKHFKGKYYLVCDIVYDSETSRELVLYRALYGDKKLFVREKDMFLSEIDHVKYPDVVQKYRFEYVNMEEL